MNDNYFCRTEAGQKGPLPFEAIQDLARGGPVRQPDLVCRSGAPEWQNAERVFGLFEGKSPGPPLESGPWEAQSCSSASPDTLSATRFPVRKSVILVGGVILLGLITSTVTDAGIGHFSVAALSKILGILVPCTGAYLFWSDRQQKSSK